MIIRTSPGLTISPSSTITPRTSYFWKPDLSLICTGISIFMASRITSGSSFATTSPALHLILKTLDGICDVILIAPGTLLMSSDFDLEAAAAAFSCCHSSKSACSSRLHSSNARSLRFFKSLSSSSIESRKFLYSTKSKTPSWSRAECSKATGSLNVLDGIFSLSICGIEASNLISFSSRSALSTSIGSNRTAMAPVQHSILSNIPGSCFLISVSITCCRPFLNRSNSKLPKSITIILSPACLKQTSGKVSDSLRLYKNLPTLLSSGSYSGSSSSNFMEELLGRLEISSRYSFLCFMSLIASLSKNADKSRGCGSIRPVQSHHRPNSRQTTRRIRIFQHVTWVATAVTTRRPAKFHFGAVQTGGTSVGVEINRIWNGVELLHSLLRDNIWRVMRTANNTDYVCGSFIVWNERLGELVAGFEDLDWLSF
ncbi:hypothetical protein OGATHE_000733 [Ogataea polymorpha]|uniref:Uncharacterized protein n=1 Tax=Ogataea polymorpha TaxID=460523 RepID=A0A9P8TFW5_9ASCO|nr:hypothetical protein OGATHE_000733 [Ogataea polymorpha]